ncbi:TetR/AcrR family transcriptional regulator [Vibrio sp. RC27]
MGRASSAEAELTRQKIVEAAFDLTMHEGFEALTFTKLSIKSGVSRSGINRHFPKKKDLLVVLEPKLTEVLMSHMNFDSPESFYSAWTDSLTNKARFRSAVLAAGPIIPTERGIKNLRRLIQGNEKEVMDCIYMCIGYAVVNLN